MLHRMAAPTFTVTATDGKARCGVLQTRNHGDIVTPAALVYTRRGAPLNLTPDMVAQLQPSAKAFQICVMHFLTNPDASKLLPGSGRGAHEFLVLDPYPVLASNRDPLSFDYGQRPSGDAAAYVTNHSGGQTVTPARYMDVVAALRPDIYITLCDEVTADATVKKLAASVKRTSEWLKACLEAHEKKGLQEAGTQALAAIAGGSSVAERKRSAAAAAAAAGVAGYALCGFGTGEDAAARPALLAAALEALPADKPRHISGLATPSEVLDGVAEGLDLFDTSYVARATAGGYALAFTLQPPPLGQQQDDAQRMAPSTSGADVGSDPSKLNLWSASYKLDKRPLLPGCTCFACRNHSRGYIHHLLNVHEMLAEVLLEAHNTHHYLLLFEEVRKAIAEGRFDAYRSWFQRSVGSWEARSLAAGEAEPLRSGEWTSH